MPKSAIVRRFLRPTLIVLHVSSGVQIEVYTKKLPMQILRIMFGKAWGTEEGRRNSMTADAKFRQDA